MMTMIECLIVDDDEIKRERIRQVIVSEIGESNVRIRTAESANEATTLLRATAFDLMVVDVNLPLRSMESPSSEGGTKLMRQVGRGTGNLIRPAFVVGITGYTELVATAAADFAEHGWALLTYAVNTSRWEESLANQCKHVWSYRQRLLKAANSYLCDALIITALAEPELDAVRQRQCKFETHASPFDTARYYKGTLPHAKGELTVVAISAPEMGNAGAAVATSKALTLFRPKACVLLGICAGIGAQVGDLAIAEFALHYESGKYKEGDGGECVFEPAPRYQSASPRLLEAIKRYNIDRAADILALPAAWPGNRPQNGPFVHVGPVAAGAAVVENTEMVKSLKFRDRKLVALEMESYGFYLACKHALSPAPEFVMVKAVCDMACPPKKDEYQKYAAFLSSSYVVSFLASEAGHNGGIFS